jgi:Asp/Glu/hydantoin racemase
MGQRIVIVNPNSTEAVTRGIAEAVAPLRFADGPEIDCLTLAEGPPGVETQAHVDGVVGPLCALIAREDNRADAFVIACFSDPGLYSARETTRRPVFGISAAAMTAALNLGERFGIIAILPTSIARHRRYIHSMGIQHRFAGELPLGLGVTELDGNPGAVGGRLTAVGARLRDECGADVVILGCAGMARYRPLMEERLGLPVVEPSQAAAAQALAAVRFGWRTPVAGRA